MKYTKKKKIIIKGPNIKNKGPNIKNNYNLDTNEEIIPR